LDHRQDQVAVPSPYLFDFLRGRLFAGAETSSATPLVADQIAKATVDRSRLNPAEAPSETVFRIADNRVGCRSSLAKLPALVQAG
jgi:hypothetical protein